MQSAFFVLLCILVALPLLQVFRRPQYIFEYPAFMAFAFAAFILPQSVALMRFPNGVRDDSVTAALLMSCLCMAMCILGYRLAPSKLAIQFASRAIDSQKLLRVGILFVAAGLVSTSILSRIDVQFSESTGGMTGAGTIVLFFRNLAFPGFAVALFAALKRPTLPRWVTVVVASIAPTAEMIMGRRENTAVLFLTVVMAFFYQRRVIPSRAVAFGMLAFSMLAIPATHEYRQYANAAQFDQIWEIDLVGNFRRFIEEPSILELRNAAAVIEATRETSAYGFGRGYWNHLVFRYMPAQYVGTSMKQAFMFESSGGPEGDVTVTGFRFSRGATVTGMGDSFAQFGWFGCLFFAFMAVIFRGMWEASLRPGAEFARLLYVMTFTSGMRAVTHWTLDFLPGFMYFLIFLGGAGLYAAVPLTNRRRRFPEKSNHVMMASGTRHYVPPH